MKKQLIVAHWNFEATCARELAERFAHSNDGVVVTHPYSPQFLDDGSVIPVDVDRQFKGDRYRVLSHEHYTAIYDVKLRMPIVSYANIDYSKRIETPLSETRTFSFDPLVPVAEQAGNEYYTHSGFDRGHVTRRRPLAWGDSLEEAENAQHQSDYFTNITLQYAYFNRVAWASVENACFDMVAAEHGAIKRSIEVTGVWFDTSKSDTYRTSSDGRERTQQRVADGFWKVCVFAGKPNIVHCYLVPQVRTGPEQVDAHQYELSIDELRKKVGFDMTRGWALNKSQAK